MTNHNVHMATHNVNNISILSYRKHYVDSGWIAGGYPMDSLLLRHYLFKFFLIVVVWIAVSCRGAILCPI